MVYHKTKYYGEKWPHPNFFICCPIFDGVFSIGFLVKNTGIVTPSIFFGISYHFWDERGWSRKNCHFVAYLNFKFSSNFEGILFIGFLSVVSAFSSMATDFFLSLAAFEIIWVKHAENAFWPIFKFLTRGPEQNCVKHITMSKTLLCPTEYFKVFSNIHLLTCCVRITLHLQHLSFKIFTIVIIMKLCIVVNYCFNNTNMLGVNFVLSIKYLVRYCDVEIFCNRNMNIKTHNVDYAMFVKSLYFKITHCDINCLTGLAIKLLKYLLYSTQMKLHTYNYDLRIKQ